MATAQELYDERIEIYEDCVNLREPKRVPNTTGASIFPYHIYGVTVGQAMRDYDKAIDAILRYHNEFQPDTAGSLTYQRSAHILEAIGDKATRWPGNGLPEDAAFQHIEYVTLQDDEYDDMFDRTAEFAMSKLLPQLYEVFEPFANIDYWDLVLNNIGVFTSAPMIESYKRLIKVSEEQAKFGEAQKRCNEALKEAGFPSFAGASGGATAFDMLGDRLRCTFGLFPDLITQPDNVKKAIDIFRELHIRNTKRNLKATGAKYAAVMLHKGFDNFISDEQYAEFYWPSLKAWMLALIEDGYIPVVFCEGKYNTRLKYLTEVPPGKVIYYFEDIDLKECKKTLGDIACIKGSFPIQTLMYGTPDEIRDKVKYTLDIMAPGGGYMFSPGCSVDRAPRENMEAMFETVREYGKY